MLPTHVSRLFWTPSPRTISGTNGHERPKPTLASRLETGSTLRLRRQYGNCRSSLSEMAANVVMGKATRRRLCAWHGPPRESLRTNHRVFYDIITRRPRFHCFITREAHKTERGENMQHASRTTFAMG